MRSPARPIVLAVVLAGIGAFTSYWSVVWLVRGSYVTVLIMLAVTVWGFGFAAFFTSTALGVGKSRIESGTSGTLLRPPRFVDTVTIAPVVAMTLACMLHLVFAPFGMVDYVTAGTMRAVPIACLFLVVFGLSTLYRMLKHRGGGHLRVDPSGYEVWNSHWNSLRRGTWDEIEDILDHKRKGRKSFNELIVFVPSRGPDAVLFADAITDNSYALREWVRFYWQHPECRNELLDERALHRLDEQAFTTE
ncbi:hypothetical protein A4X20_02125 [Mycolicibacterium iranicum]|uniref:Uncharacterized protein n=1 Tax=Mycolicibacterium iranicum TaxID=912594 RepID=A0A178M547_MYCIR|nr:hypothetical protein A4X20_02125 [Mycolicibacterium iranicum]